MSYQLSPICHTDAALNCDVTQEGQYLGRLYVFPTSNPDLIAMKIEKEWFLAHSEGFVVSGHINTEKLWSLSSHQSLQPSKEFTTFNEIFDRVFSSEYLQDILNFRNSEQSSAFQKVAVKNNNDNESNGDSSIGQPAIFDNQLSMDWGTLIPHLDVLRELLVGEGEQEQSVSADEFEEVSPEELEEGAFVRLNREQVVRILNEELEESEHLKIQEALINTVVEEYREQERTEFVLPPFGTVTIQAVEEYFVLRSDSDGRAILTATLAGEVIDKLSLADAVKFSEVLRQSEIEVPQWVTTNAELLGDDLKIDGDSIPKENKELKGVEYGD